MFMAKSRDAQPASDPLAAAIEVNEGILVQTLKETLAELKAIRALLEQPKGTALRELSQAGRHNPPAELT
jgi:hypothetical protein